MITPKEVHDKDFKRSLRGYDMDDVDQFLDKIIKDLEEIYKENANLKDELDQEIKKNNQYLEMENSLNKALLHAEKTAESIKREAILEKDTILIEARKKADSFSSDNRELVEKSKKFKNELINLFEKQIENIKEFGIIEEFLDIFGENQKTIKQDINKKVDITKETVKASDTVIAQVANTEEENFGPDYNDEFDNGLLDEEEEEFKNKVFKFLDK